MFVRAIADSGVFFDHGCPLMQVKLETEPVSDTRINLKFVRTEIKVAEGSPLLLLVMMMPSWSFSCLHVQPSIRHTDPLAMRLACRELSQSGYRA